jgi:hypothetical protein
LFADLLVDRRGPSDVWMYVVQRRGQPDILAMGSCQSEDEARETATRLLRQFTSRNAAAS